MNSTKSVEPSSSKKFCIDPRLANFRTMQYLIAQAFEMKSDFTISAIQKFPITGQEKATVIWSDWDLDEAIKNVAPGSYLRLRFESTNCEEGQLVYHNQFDRKRMVSRCRTGRLGLHSFERLCNKYPLVKC